MRRKYALAKLGPILVLWKDLGLSRSTLVQDIRGYITAVVVLVRGLESITYTEPLWLVMLNTWALMTNLSSATFQSSFTPSQPNLDDVRQRGSILVCSLMDAGSEVGGRVSYRLCVWQEQCIFFYSESSKNDTWYVISRAWRSHDRRSDDFVCPLFWHSSC